MRKKNKHIGSSFESFLKEDGIYEEVTAAAIKRTIALQIEQEMAAQNISKAEMSRRLRTSASQLGRLLDPDNDKIQLDTLYKAARAVGKALEVRLI
jgi:predicted XRE-type DNA-binding protein